LAGWRAGKEIINIGDFPTFINLPNLLM